MITSSGQKIEAWGSFENVGNHLPDWTACDAAVTFSFRI